MAANIEDALMIHKNEIIFYDQKANTHYRMTLDNLKKITFDHVEVKRFFGLKKEILEVIRFTVEDEDIPETLELREDEDPSFHRFIGGLRSFVDDNKVDLEIKRLDQ